MKVWRGHGGHCPGIEGRVECAEILKSGVLGIMVQLALHMCSFASLVCCKLQSQGEHQLETWKDGRCWWRTHKTA